MNYKNLENIKENLDNIIHQFNKIDNIKKRCSQWTNPKGCCNGGDYFLCKEEGEDILRYLRSNPDKKTKVGLNIKSNSKCYFYDKQNLECLIKTVRPIICRYVSLRIFQGKDGTYKACSPNKFCNKKDTTILSFDKVNIIDFKNNSFVKCKVEDKDAYFLNFKNFDFLEKYYKEDKIKISEFLKEKEFE